MDYYELRQVLQSAMELLQKLRQYNVVGKKSTVFIRLSAHLE